MEEQPRVEEYPNWFAGTDAIHNFAKFLEPYKDKPGLQFLQLGVYTGDATVWLLENILTNPTSRLIDVDTWQGSDEEIHHEMDFDAIYDFYQKRISKFNNVLDVRSTTLRFLKLQPEDRFDFIYIDADHTAVGVLLDAELSWLCLKSGGILAFDDYQWRERTDRDDLHPQPGIHSFLERHNGEFELLVKNWQLWVRKK